MATIAALIGMQRDKKPVKILVNSQHGKSRVIPHDLIPPRITAVRSIRDKNNTSLIIGWRFTCFTCHGQNTFMPHQHENACQERLTHRCRKARTA